MNLSNILVAICQVIMIGIWQEWAFPLIAEAYLSEGELFIAVILVVLVLSVLVYFPLAVRARLRHEPNGVLRGSFDTESCTQTPLGKCVVECTLRGACSSTRSIQALYSLSDQPIEDILVDHHWYWADPVRGGYPLQRLYQPYPDQYDCPRVLLVPNYGGMYGQVEPVKGRKSMPNPNPLLPPRNFQAHRYSIMLWTSLDASGEHDPRIRPWGMGDNWFEKLGVHKDEVFIVADICHDMYKKSTFPTLAFLVKGAKIPTLLDSRGAFGDPVWTDNPADIILWFVRTRYVEVLKKGEIILNIDYQSFYESKILCNKDRQVKCPKGFPYPDTFRYAINGVIPAGDRQCKEILAQMLMACAGTLGTFENPLPFYAGDWMPVKTIYHEDFAEDLKIEKQDPRQSEIRIQSELHEFQNINLTPDFAKLIPPVSVKFTLHDDNHFHFVNHPTQALMVSMIALQKYSSPKWSAKYPIQKIEDLAHTGNHVLFQFEDGESWRSEITMSPFPVGSREPNKIHISGRRLPDDLYDRLDIYVNEFK